MATQILYQKWDGGGGYNDSSELIGYCKEEPLEVLKSIIMTHDVYHYLDLYRPIDYDFPNNVAGLIINKFEDCCNGITVTGSLSDLDLSQAKTTHTREKDQILYDLELCRQWHTYSTNSKLQKKYWSIIDEIKEYVENNL